MACDTKLKPKQTIQGRAAEVRAAVAALARGLASGAIKARVGAQGAVAFEGWQAAERDGVTDACAYRRLLVSGGPLALAALARAEQLAGRSVNRQVIAVGVHSHDGGRNWHSGH
jgi:hypothetical protein